MDVALKILDATWQRIVAIMGTQLTWQGIIASLAVYIAYRQWLTDKAKVRLEMFDRRYRLFEEIRKVLFLVTSDANVTTQSLVQFKDATVAAYFIAGPEIAQYIDEMYKRGLSLQSANKNSSRSGISEAELKAFVEQSTNDLNWFGDQYDVIKEKFKKCLDVSKL